MGENGERVIICSKGCPPFGGICVEACHHAGAVDSGLPCDAVRVERGEDAFRGGSEGVVVWRRGAEEADEFAVFDCRRAGHSGEFRGISVRESGYRLPFRVKVFAYNGVRRREVFRRELCDGVKIIPFDCYVLLYHFRSPFIKSDFY